MNENTAPLIRGRIVEEEVSLTLGELCRASDMSIEQAKVWVFEGILDPSGPSPQEWKFGGYSLSRVRTGMRLSRDLDISIQGIGLVLDLLEKISELEGRLNRVNA